TFTLPDGRILSYATFGPSPSPEIPVIVYCHGFPGSRSEAAFIDNKQLPLHVISIDRPGMGLSTFQPSRRILDWPADVLALLEHLQIPQFYVLGDSGGSPYALACVKEIPRERLLGASVVSGIYPLTLGMQGMSFGIKAFMTLGTWLPSWAVAKLLDLEFGKLIREQDQKKAEEIFMKAMEGRSERDIRCLDDLEFRFIAVESTREAFRQGSIGPAWDLGLFGSWGFGLEELDGKRVMLWHGKKDINTPFLMAEKAAKVLSCELKAFEEETHLSLPYNNIEEIIAGMLK
ncbi:Alpha/Beta hydrolase protein, partial [Xylogone sp. PMI_703]